MKVVFKKQPFKDLEMILRAFAKEEIFIQKFQLKPNKSSERLQYLDQDPIPSQFSKTETPQTDLNKKDSFSLLLLVGRLVSWESQGFSISYLTSSYLL